MPSSLGPVPLGGQVTDCETCLHKPKGIKPGLVNMSFIVQPPTQAYTRHMAQEQYQGNSCQYPRTYIPLPTSPHKIMMTLIYATVHSVH